jgi:hypothetical protein
MVAANEGLMQEMFFAGLVDCSVSYLPYGDSWLQSIAPCIGYSCADDDAACCR